MRARRNAEVVRLNAADPLALDHARLTAHGRGLTKDRLPLARPAGDDRHMGQGAAADQPAGADANRGTGWRALGESEPTARGDAVQVERLFFRAARGIWIRWAPRPAFQETVAFRIVSSRSYVCRDHARGDMTDAG